MERDNNNINLINISLKCFICNTITNESPIVVRRRIKILIDEHIFKIVYIYKKINEY